MEVYPDRVLPFRGINCVLIPSDLLASARHGVNVDYKWGEYLMGMCGWYKRRDAVGVCTTFIQNLK